MGDVGDEVAAHLVDTPGLADIVDHQCDLPGGPDRDGAHPHRGRLPVRPRAPQRRLRGKRRRELLVERRGAQRGAAREQAQPVHGEFAPVERAELRSGLIGEQHLAVTPHENDPGGQPLQQLVLEPGQPRRRHALRLADHLHRRTPTAPGARRQKIAHGLMLDVANSAILVCERL